MHYKLRNFHKKIQRAIMSPYPITYSRHLTLNVHYRHLLVSKLPPAASFVVVAMNIVHRYFKLFLPENLPENTN